MSFYELSFNKLNVSTYSDLIKVFIRLRTKYLDLGCRLYEDVIPVSSISGLNLDELINVIFKLID